MAFSLKNSHDREGADNFIFDTQVKSTSTSNCKRDNNIIIMDWDDTILCSSWFVKKGYKLSTPLMFGTPIFELDSEAEQFLHSANEHAHLIFITNAEDRWIELSAEKYMPKVHKALQELDVKIVSARTENENITTDTSLHKLMSFYKHVGHHITENKLSNVNVVSIGDAIYERRAAQSLGAMGHSALKDCTRVISKSIKTIERPSPTLMSKQLKYLRDTVLENIIYHKDNIHLDIVTASMPVYSLASVSV